MGGACVGEGSGEVCDGGPGAVVDRSNCGRASGCASGLEVRGANLWLAKDGGGPAGGGGPELSAGESLEDGGVVTDVLLGGLGCDGAGE